MQKLTVFDIETRPLLAEKLPPFDESKVAVGNLRDPEKIKAKIEEARKEWLDSAALSPLTGEVCLVGFTGNHTGILDIEKMNGEIEVLQAALGVIQDELRAGNLIVGFNSNEFDLRFIIKRAWAHGLKMPAELRNGRYWDRSLVDLRELWLLGEYGSAKGTSSLNVVARHLGYDPKLCEDKYEPGLTYEQLREHLKMDLAKTFYIATRLMP